MPVRPKSTANDLPPRLLRRQKTLASGKVWVGYYYNGRTDDGKRVEIPLGSDLNEAKRKWAQLECKPAPVETGLMKSIFDRYEREVIPTKAPRTQRDNLAELKMLRAVFNSAPIDAITPQHIAQYRDRREAKTRANRELALFSHVFNQAREWGYTAKENPCRGVRKNKEMPRAFYADDAVYNAVYAHACQELKDALDVAYLSGQRPGDVKKMRLSDIAGDALEVVQGKTGKRLRILLTTPQGQRTRLGEVIDKIMTRPQKITSMYLVATTSGQPLTEAKLRLRFEKARAAAKNAAAAAGNIALSERIGQFQYRDVRPKAATEIDSIEQASKLLGHSEKQITRTVYRRIGESVNPTR